MLYITNSSHFDYSNNQYDVEKFSNALKRVGARTTIKHQYGWFNQPEVVCFDSINQDKAEQVLNRLTPFNKQWGVIINEVDWIDNE